MLLALRRGGLGPISRKLALRNTWMAPKTSKNWSLDVQTNLYKRNLPATAVNIIFRLQLRGRVVASD